MARMRSAFIILFVLIISCKEKNKGNDPEPRENIGKKSAFPPNVYLVNNGGCVYRDSIVVDSLGHDLYRDKDGNLYLKTWDVSDMVNDYPVLISRLYNYCQGDSSFDLKRHIDVSSFASLGGSFYKDKITVFYHNQMADGGNIVIVEGADASAFQVFPSSNYASDRRKIFYKSSPVVLADPVTFTVIYKVAEGDTLWAFYGKDQRYYYCDDDTCQKKEVDLYLLEK